MSLVFGWLLNSCVGYVFGVFFVVNEIKVVIVGCDMLFVNRGFGDIGKKSGRRKILLVWYLRLVVKIFLLRFGCVLLKKVNWLFGCIVLRVEKFRLISLLRFCFWVKLEEIFRVVWIVWFFILSLLMVKLFVYIVLWELDLFLYLIFYVWLLRSLDVFDLVGL